MGDPLNVGGIGKPVGRDKGLVNRSRVVMAVTVHYERSLGSDGVEGFKAISSCRHERSLEVNVRSTLLTGTPAVNLEDNLIQKSMVDDPPLLRRAA